MHVSMCLSLFPVYVLVFEGQAACELPIAELLCLFPLCLVDVYLLYCMPYTLYCSYKWMLKHLFDHFSILLM